MVRLWTDVLEKGEIDNMENVRIIAAIVLLVIGTILSTISVIGTFRFKFVLNRMHAAAIADTGGLLFCVAGLCLLTGFSFVTLKFIAIIVFFWVASPVASHLISNLVYHTMEKDTAKNAGMVDEGKNTK